MDGIHEAVSASAIAKVRALMLEYAESLHFDLCFQGFDRELASLPGDYARPDGCLLLAYHAGAPVGCVALRKHAEGIAEMKRLYVRPAARGLGLGRALTQRVIAAARGAGYRSVILDTLADMTGAQHLYRRLGFRDIEAYYDNPIPGAQYLQLDL